MDKILGTGQKRKGPAKTNPTIRNAAAFGSASRTDRIRNRYVQQFFPDYAVANEIKSAATVCADRYLQSAQIFISPCASSRGNTYHTVQSE
ncbi:hypothetical protein RvY_16161 [Ramazzottius varieornatus]|uniref:Uncharacterized protein n=1 Tax=Ramazzottius varieornatus TaxID=947166 RepID=A0A1D1VXH3_RAMVA|nr:hypothetical protein RvY_16161 [Ramazzottius varieornatus]